MINKLTPHHFPNGFPWTPRGSFPFCTKGGAVNKVGGLLLRICLLACFEVRAQKICLLACEPPPTLFAAMNVPTITEKLVFHWFYKCLLKSCFF